jgi:predicted transcriptional regulator
VRTVILDVSPPNKALTDLIRVWKSGKGEKAARISFASPELLWKVLSVRRWEILKAMCAVGPLSIREVARRVERDVKAVHGDVVGLIEAGLLQRTDSGGVEFPFDAIKVKFLIEPDKRSRPTLSKRLAAFDPARHGGEAMVTRPKGADKR